MDLDHAREHAADRDWSGAADAYRVAIVSGEARPEDWRSFARALHEVGAYREALRAHGRALELALDGDRAEALFEAARTLATLGQLDEALRRLREARRAGFDGLARLQDEPDLDPLRDDPRFLNLMGRW